MENFTVPGRRNSALVYVKGCIFLPGSKMLGDIIEQKIIPGERCHFMVTTTNICVPARLLRFVLDKIQNFQSEKMISRGSYVV